MAIKADNWYYDYYYRKNFWKERTLHQPSKPKKGNQSTATGHHPGLMDIGIVN